MTETPSPTDFEAAAAVAAALKDLSKPRQELVLRWVAESLGVAPARDAQTPLHVPAAAPAAPAVPARVVTPTETPVDIKTFVAAKAPKTDIQFVTVAAYYYRFLAAEDKRANHITVDSAQDATRLADWDRLKNPRSTLNNAKNQGYLDATGGGKFVINTVGENLVARSLPTAAEGTKAKRSGAKAKGRKKRASKRR